MNQTHKKIAFEKAGIIKNRIPIIVGEKDIKTEDTFIEISRKLNAPLYFVKNTSANFTSDLKGFYQIKNIQTVITAFNPLPKRSGEIFSVKFNCSTTGIAWRLYAPSVNFWNC